MGPINEHISRSNRIAIRDLASKTSITTTHQFADATARDAYFVTNPTELTEGLFIKVGTGYQQYLSETWEDVSAVLIEQVQADTQLINDAGNYYASNNTEGALQEVGSDMADIATQQQTTNLKISTVEKDLKDYQQTLATVNINQEAKQSVTGYGNVSFPKNTANGQVSCSVKGRTLKNELNYNRDTWEEWTKTVGKVVGDSTGLEFTFSDVSPSATAILSTGVKNSQKYGLLLNVASNTLSTKRLELSNEYTGNYITLVGAGIIGNIKLIFTTQSNITTNQLKILQNAYGDLGLKIKLKDIRIFELPTGSQIETDFNTLTADQLAQKYPYISGGTAKSTISAGRLKGVNVNLLPTNISEWEIGTINPLDGILQTATNRLRMRNFYKIKRNSVVVPSCQNGFDVRAIFYYDNAKNFISAVTGSPINTTVPYDATYYKAIIRKIDDSSITVQNFENIKPQLEYGTVATAYTPHQHSELYYSAKDSNGNIVESKSVGTAKDEVRFNQSTEEYEHVKRVSNNETVNGIDNWTDFGIYTDNTFCYARIDGWATSRKIGENFEATALSSDGNYTKSLTLSKSSQFSFISGRLMLTIAKSKLDVMTSGATLEGFKEYLNLYPITLTYQLATPIITPIETSGTVMSYPSGSMWVEKATADAGIYTDKFSILQQDLPIAELEKISKIDFTTGVETELDVSLAVVASDKLSFTHPSLTADDLVFVTYFFDKESTEGEMTAEFYDSRYVLKDSVTGKYYKNVQTVANEVLTDTLVEV
jgi:hypothetical protein